MNQTRTLLVFALCFVAYLLWQQWTYDYAPAPGPAAASSVAASAAAAPGTAQTPGAVPAPTVAKGAAPATAAAPVTPAIAATVTESAHALVSITTDALHLAVDPAGANLVQADLLKYPTKLHSPTSVRLLSSDAENFYVAENGLTSATAPVPEYGAVFNTARSSYTLPAGQDTESIDFTWTDPSGLTVIKRFIVTRGSYVVKVEQRINNGSANTWTGNAYRQFQRVQPPEPTDENFAAKWANPARYSFAGAAWYSGGKYDTLKYKDFSDDPLSLTDKGGWIAMQQAFFLGAWIPAADEVDHYSSAVLPNASAPNPRYIVRVVADPISVAPGTTGVTAAELFLGPKTPRVLDTAAPGLKLAVNYGMLTVISKPLHWILSVFESWVGNWGIAIILLVILIKAVFFKLSEIQYRSMAKMKKLGPQIKSLKTRFPDDKAKQQQEMMALYKKEKANPAGGCLPMLVQIPVFFGLYYMLPQSVELRQAPFFLWIHDLLLPDPYFVLPAIYAAILIGTQFLTPTTGMDPTQAKMMKFMPVLFAVMFAFFPAGLVLYYVVNGALSLAQQWVITKRIEAEPSRS